MTKVDEYRKQLRDLDDWDSFLMAESGLPGPRGNLSLADAAAEGFADQFWHWLGYTAEKAPTNTPGEFLSFCGVVGLGRLLAEGDRSVLPTIRACASDVRWRRREGVAMALPRWGDVDMNALIDEMEVWSTGSLLEQRAAAAALCEPRLLKASAQVERVLNILDAITTSLLSVDDRKSDDFLALRKGLAYCWSVAVAAALASGKGHMEKWLDSCDHDIMWIMRENLKKARLVRMDADWVKAAQEKLL
jgi:hypothetical protein